MILRLKKSRLTSLQRSERFLTMRTRVRKRNILRHYFSVPQDRSAITTKKIPTRVMAVRRVHNQKVAHLSRIRWRRLKLFVQVFHSTQSRCVIMSLIVVGRIPSVVNLGI